MRRARLLALLAVPALLLAARPAVTMDADSNYYYMPVKFGEGARPPCLVVLSCVGAERIDLDTCLVVADSLGWAMATCHATRNHRSSDSNDVSVVTVLRRLRTCYVDSTRVFLFGFSGQGVQALASMLRHPDLVRGVVATCAHAGGLPVSEWPEPAGQVAYLVTRQRDWNRAPCQDVNLQLNEHGVISKLVTTPGVHEPGTRFELLDACRWLNRLTRE